MKNKILRLIGTISAFFLSILGLTGCRGEMQALYGVPPGIQQDLYGVPAPTQKYDMYEVDTSTQENPETTLPVDLNTSSDI